MKGALYVAYGEKARAACLRSIETLREYIPEMAVAVVSDTPLPGIATQHVYQPEADPGARTWKTQMYMLSPFDETLFLDADTEVVSSPEAGFSLLRFVDVVMAQDENHRLADCHWRGHDVTERSMTLAQVGCDGDLLYYNTGVVFFKRNERAEVLFTAWHREWQRWKLHDQLAFARALYTHPVRMATVRESWNTRLRTKARFVWHNHHSVRREGAPL